MLLLFVVLAVRVIGIVVVEVGTVNNVLPQRVGVIKASPPDRMWREVKDIVGKRS